eukprot:gene8308-11263_t
MALYPQDVISREIVDQELRSDFADSPIEKTGMPSGSMTISQAVEENMRTYFASFGEALPPSGLYDRVLTEMEYPLILAALTATRGNQIKAADLLGLNRNTLRKKIRELGVSRCSKVTVSDVACFRSGILIEKSQRQSKDTLVFRGLSSVSFGRRVAVVEADSMLTHDRRASFALPGLLLAGGALACASFTLPVLL